QSGLPGPRGPGRTWLRDDENRTDTWDPPKFSRLGLSGRKSPPRTQLRFRPGARKVKNGPGQVRPSSSSRLGLHGGRRVAGVCMGPGCMRQQPSPISPTKGSSSFGSGPSAGSRLTGGHSVPSLTARGPESVTGKTEKGDPGTFRGRGSAERNEKGRGVSSGRRLLGGGDVNAI